MKKNDIVFPMEYALNELRPRPSRSLRQAHPLSSLSRKNKMSLRAYIVAARATNEDNIKRKIQRSKPERHETAALGAAIRGKTEGIRRISVRFIGYRTRPLDPDNFAGGCKDLLDGLRHAGLISGDEPWRIKFETSQVKVSHRSDERTEIQIETDEI